MSNYQKKFWKRGKSGMTPVLAADLNKYEDYLFMHDQQIENLTHIPEGSTTADLEVIDGRVGYDGEIFNSLGDAIRGQIEVVTGNVKDLKAHTRTNLLNPTAKTQTVNGVTFTNNGDGTYTVNGTASERAFYLLANQFTDLDLSREYKMVGCPQGGSGNSYSLYDDMNVRRDFGNGVIYKPTNQPRLYIRIEAGTTCNNLLFKPMLTTDLSATYDDFVQYSGDGELNENVAEIYKVSDRVSDETYTNLLNPNAKTTTKNGVTFTNNGDGTYTVNGTASARANITIQRDIAVNVGDKFRICGGSNDVNISIVYFKSNTYVTYLECAEDRTFQVPNGVDSMSIELVVYATVTNKVIKPMLTTKLDATYGDFIHYSGSGALNENVQKMYKDLSSISLNNIVKYKEYQVTFDGAEARIDMENDGILAVRVLSVMHNHSSGVGYAIQFIPSTNPYQITVARQRWNSGTPQGITTSEIVTLRVNYY